MLRRFAVVTVAALLASGCGDDDDGGAAAPPAATALDPALAGTWTGTTTVSVPGSPPFSNSLVIGVSGQDATVSGICPDGSGAVTAQGTGNSATWQGSFTCPPFAVAGTCAAVALTYQNATVTLNGDGTLTAKSSGVAGGCGFSLPVTLTFNGTK